MPSLKKLFKTVVSELVKIIGMNFYVKTIKCLPISNRLRGKFVNAAYCQSFKKFIKSEGFYYQSDCNDALNFSARLDFMDWEVNSRRVFAKFAANADLILDVGSYTGIYAMTAALNSPRASVIAFEPNPIISANLNRNIKINNLSNQVEVQQVALSNANGYLNLNIGKDSSMASTLSSKNEGLIGTEQNFQVITKPLDDYNFLKPISLIKVDIEGSELTFLEGARKTLELNSPIILMEALNEDEFQSQLTFLQTLGYMCLGSAGELTGDERNFLWSKQFVD